MVSGRRRRLPGAQSAVRWVAVDARDVACIHGSSAGPAVAFQGDIAVATVEAGLARWQRRVERRRRLAVGRRAVLLGLGAACVLQLGALASGHDGPGPWLLPAAVLAVIAIGVGVAHGTSPVAAARLLDRDLDLGAEVTTALELETSAESAGRSQGLGALALADARVALGRSLPSARARLRSQRRETALLAALVPAVAALLLVSGPRTSTPAAAAVSAPGANVVNRALRAEDGVTGGTAGAGGASLQGLAPPEIDAPPLVPVETDGARRAGAATSGGSSDGTRGGDAQPGGGRTTPATGQGGAVAPSDGSDGTSQQSREETGESGSKTPGGTAGGGSAATRPDGAAGSAGKPYRGGRGAPRSAGAEHVARIPSDAGTSPPGASSAPPEKGKTRATPRTGGGTSAPGATPGRKPDNAVPGGASAGVAPGSQGTGAGVVPELRGDVGLPLSPTYEAVLGAGRTSGSTTAKAGGAGGSGRSEQASGSTSGSAARGVAWVPPGGDAVASTDRGVVRGYFGSLARVNSSGW